MAKEGTVINIIIRCTISGGTPTVDAISYEGVAKDDAATNDYDKGPHPISDGETWNGTDTGDTIVTTCWNAMKTKAGIA